MKGKVLVTGMILSSTSVGETDKRVTILTKENGKITAFAKGAKKPTSPLLAVTNPFVFGEFELYIGRSSYSIIKATISNYFNEVSQDLERVYYGSYLLELADYYTHENNDEIEILKLLYQSVRALCHEGIPNKLIKAIYEMKLLYIVGEYPNFFECSVCGEGKELTGFSFINNGMVCSECCESVADFVSMDSSAIYALQFIINTPVEKLFTFNVTDKVLEQMNKVIKYYIDKSIDRPLRSLVFLQELIANPF